MAQVAILRVVLGKLQVFISVDHTHCHNDDNQDDHEGFGFLEISYRAVYYFF